MKIIFDTYTIRPITLEDAEDYFLFIDRNRSRISHYFPKTCNANKNRTDTIDFINSRIVGATRKELLKLVVTDNNTNKIMGAVILKDMDWSIPKCEFGFFIDGDYEGKGITGKAVAHVVKYCFKELKMNKIFMRIAENNISSIRVAEKNNFALEGKLRKDFKTFNGTLIDVLYYGLLR